MEDPKPTKARSEFKGDCFGRLYKRSAPECEICLVSRKCQAAKLARAGVNSEPNTEGEQAVAKTKEAKKSKKDKAEKKSKKGKGEYREGSFIWALHTVIEKVMKPKFNVEKLERATKALCSDKDVKIKFKPNRIPHLLRWFASEGILKKVGKGEYKRIG